MPLVIVGNVNFVPSGDLVHGKKEKEQSVHTVGAGRDTKQDICLHVKTPIAEDHLQVIPLESFLLLLSMSSSIFDESLKLKEADFVGCKPPSAQCRRVD